MTISTKSRLRSSIAAGALILSTVVSPPIAGAASPAMDPTAVVADLGTQGIQSLRQAASSAERIARLGRLCRQEFEIFKRLQAQAAALNPDNPKARDLVSQARAAIEVGDFSKAQQLLAEAVQVQIAAAQQARKIREQAQQAEDAQLVGAAAATATQGDLAMTELKYGQAAELFKQAAALVSPGHPTKMGNYLSRQAIALYRKATNTATAPR